MKDKLLNGLNLFLTIDFFFVLASFLWFAIALAGRSLDIPLGFDAWHRLWEPVFMPAIGLIMAGALVSGASSWLTKKWDELKSE